MYRTWHTAGRGTEQLGYTFGLIHQPLDPPCTSIGPRCSCLAARMLRVPQDAGPRSPTRSPRRPTPRSRVKSAPSSCTPTCCGTCPARGGRSSMSAGVRPTSRCRSHASASRSPSSTPSPAMLAKAEQRLDAEPEEVRRRVRLVEALGEHAEQATGGQRFAAVLCHGGADVPRSTRAVARVAMPMRATGRAWYP